MLNNNSFLALFVFLTYCFASNPTKLHRVFSHLVHPLAIYVQCGLNLFFFRQDFKIFPLQRTDYLGRELHPFAGCRRYL